LEALQVDTNFGISLRGLLLASFTYSIHNDIDNLIIFIFCLHIFVLQHFISLHSSFSVVIMLFLAPSPGLHLRLRHSFSSVLHKTFAMPWTGAEPSVLFGMGLATRDTVDGPTFRTEK
jgi:hypothetical protein